MSRWTVSNQDNDPLNLEELPFGRGTALLSKLYGGS